MNKTEVKEFESLLDIDKTRLDDEAEKQPYKVWRYGKLSAKALRDVDEAIADLKLAEADVDAAIRQKPSKFGIEKITEPAVKRAILRSREYKEALKLLNNAHYRVRVLDAANKALDHRRTSLSMLDGQDARNYYSRPAQKVRTDTGRSQIRKALRKKRSKRARNS
jgi:hypothetical protein